MGHTHCSCGSTCAWVQNGGLLAPYAIDRRRLLAPGRWRTHAGAPVELSCASPRSAAHGASHRSWAAVAVCHRLSGFSLAELVGPGSPPGTFRQQLGLHTTIIKIFALVARRNVVQARGNGSSRAGGQHE